MTDLRLINDIQEFVKEQGEGASPYATRVSGLSVLCDRVPSAFEAMVYDPVVCLVLQGGKETRVGGRRVRFGAGDSLIVSHTLPVGAAITEASPDKPYVAMILAVDLGIARSLYDEIDDVSPDAGVGRCLDASKSAPELIDAFARLFRASLDPVEAEALAPLIIREIHFRCEPACKIDPCIGVIGVQK